MLALVGDNVHASNELQQEQDQRWPNKERDEAHDEHEVGRQIDEADKEDQAKSQVCNDT